jgi:hypothetical protein
VETARTALADANAGASQFLNGVSATVVAVTFALLVGYVTWVVRAGQERLDLL